jgi:hypothetical protein
MMNVAANTSGRDWEGLETGVPYPVSFTSEEIEAHKKPGEGWNERQDFWEALEGFVSRHGETSNEFYEDARKRFEEFAKEIGEENLAALRGTKPMSFEE